MRVGADKVEGLRCIMTIFTLVRKMGEEGITSLAIEVYREGRLETFLCWGVRYVVKSNMLELQCDWK